MRYGQVQQHLGQLIGIRKHATTPCSDLVVNGSDAVVHVRSEGYVAERNGDRMRTGSEPTTARSALRARFWLSLRGVVWALFGTTAFALTGRPGWAIACGVLWLVITVDLALIVRHMRQGPHYQPGPDIPPYRPPDNGRR
ncbi:hypothetical protein SALBM311S_01048 [Streptomyces alboniger]